MFYHASAAIAGKRPAEVDSRLRLQNLSTPVETCALVLGVAGDQAPGMGSTNEEVVVMMQNRVIIFCVLWFGLGCTTVHPKFENSNQLFVEKTVENLDLGGQLRGRLPAGSRVALRSLETEVTIDKAVVAIIEDQLLRSLLAGGFKALERDRHGVENLVEEKAGVGYALMLAQSSTSDKKRPCSCDGNRSCAHACERESATNSREPVRFLQTDLAAAQYVVSYRILECGLVYRNDAATAGNVAREGLVRLHVRLTNAASGELLFAENLSGTLRDEIRTAFRNQLADYHYSHFPYEYPLQPKEAGQARVLSSSSDIDFYVAPGIGLPAGGTDIDEIESGIMLGVSTRFGRVGATAYMVLDTDLAAYSVVYEYPIQLFGPIYVTPRAGLGFFQDQYGWRDYTSGAGIVLGAAAEVQLAKWSNIQLGYYFNASLINSTGDAASSGAMMVNVGFTL